MGNPESVTLSPRHVTMADMTTTVPGARTRSTGVTSAAAMSRSAGAGSGSGSGSGGAAMSPSVAAATAAAAGAVAFDQRGTRRFRMNPVIDYLGKFRDGVSMVDARDLSVALGHYWCTCDGGMGWKTMCWHCYAAFQINYDTVEMDADQAMDEAVEAAFTNGVTDMQFTLLALRLAVTLARLDEYSYQHHCGRTRAYACNSGVDNAEAELDYCCVTAGWADEVADGTLDDVTALMQEMADRVHELTLRRMVQRALVDVVLFDYQRALYHVLREFSLASPATLEALDERMRREEADAYGHEPERAGGSQLPDCWFTTQLEELGLRGAMEDLALQAMRGWVDVYDEEYYTDVRVYVLRFLDERVHGTGAGAGAS